MILQPEITMSDEVISTAPDKTAIQAEWMAMREGFHQLLADIPSEAWRQKTKDTKWTIAELCTHIVHDVEGVPQYVDHARRGKDFLNLPSKIVNFMNWLITKIMGRKATPELLAKKFDKVYGKAMSVLDTIQDDEWQHGANFFGESYWTIEYIFHQSPNHFEEHAAQIRKSL